MKPDFIFGLGAIVIVAILFLVNPYLGGLALLFAVVAMWFQLESKGANP